MNFIFSQKLLKIGIISFFVITVCTAFSQDNKALKSCIVENDHFLVSLKNSQINLTKKLIELQNKQQLFEKDRDASVVVTNNIINESENLIQEGNKLNSEIQLLRSKLLKISSIAEKKYFNNSLGVTRFIGNSTIEEGDKIYSNVSSINADILIAGEVKGDLCVINGTLTLQNNSRINGKIILINADYYSEPNSKYSDVSCGEINSNDEPYNEYSEERLYSIKISPPSLKIPGTDIYNGGEIRYNRVEGLYLGVNIPKRYFWSGKTNYSFYGTGGYGFANHSWQGSIGLDKWIGNENRTELGAEVHNVIDSKDNWLITVSENTTSALLIHEDFMDYYKKVGWSSHASQYISKNMRLQINYIDDKYYNISRNTDWALFGGKKTFRENQNINEGNLKSLIFGFDHITVYGKDYNPQGWIISSQYEVGFGDFDFKRFSLDVRRYQKITSDTRINARMIFGTSENFLPVQRLYEIGGLGSIPACRYKEFSGNRMLLGNVELLIRFSEVDDYMVISDLLNNTDVILFYDAGLIDYVDQNYQVTEGFNNFTLKNVKHDLGIALGLGRGSFRIGATFRLDKPEPAKLFIRLSQPF